MHRLLELLRQSATDQEQVVVAYAAGSRPGIARPLTVVEVLPGEWPQFRAKEPGSSELKTYSSKQVLWVEDRRGARITNDEKVASYSAYLRRKEQDAHQLNNLLHSPSATSLSRSEIKVSFANQSSHLASASKNASRWK